MVSPRQREGLHCVTRETGEPSHAGQQPAAFHGLHQPEGGCTIILETIKNEKKTDRPKLYGLYCHVSVTLCAFPPPRACCEFHAPAFLTGERGPTSCDGCFPPATSLVATVTLQDASESQDADVGVGAGSCIFALAKYCSSSSLHAWVGGGGGVGPPPPTVPKPPGAMGTVGDGAATAPAALVLCLMLPRLRSEPDGFFLWFLQKQPNLFFFF